MLPETVGRLSHLPNIIGVKEATGDLSRITTIRALAGVDFAIYSGDDATSREACLVGANGSITVTGNVAPKLVHEMLLAAIKGDAETALALDTKLFALHEHLFIQANPIPVKWAVAEMGLMAKGIRLPLTWLTEDCYDTVRQAMQQADITCVTTMKNRIRFIAIGIATVVLAGCSYVKSLFPDKERDYQYTTEIPMINYPADLRKNQSASSVSESSPPAAPAEGSEASANTDSSDQPPADNNTSSDTAPTDICCCSRSKQHRRDPCRRI